MMAIVIPLPPPAEASLAERTVYEMLLQTAEKHDRKQKNKPELAIQKKVIDDNEKILAELKIKRIKIWGQYSTLTKAIETHVKDTENFRSSQAPQINNFKSPILDDARDYYTSIMKNADRIASISALLKNYETIKTLKEHVDALNTLYRQRIFEIDDKLLLSDAYLREINKAIIDLNTLYTYSKEYFEKSFECTQSLNLIDVDIRCTETAITIWSERYNYLNSHTTTYIEKYQNQIVELTQQLETFATERKRLAESSKENKKDNTAKAETKKSSSSTTSSIIPRWQLSTRTLMDITKEVVNDYTHGLHTTETQNTPTTGQNNLDFAQTNNRAGI